MVLSMDRWVGQVAIVTGASSGIGAAIAEQLVDAGLQVAGLARRKEKLEDLAVKLSGRKGKFHPVQTDLLKEEDILNAFKWLKENLGPVHILINNAGLASRSLISEQKTEELNAIFQVNVIGLCIATREAVKDMKENKVDGHIIHINSVLGHHVLNIPELNVYPATKHAVTALTETVRLELNRLGLKIRVTSISPGLVDTEMITEEDKKSPIIQDIYEKNTILKVEDIADGVIYVLSTPPHVQVHELMIRPTGDCHGY